MTFLSRGTILCALLFAASFMGCDNADTTEDDSPAALGARPASSATTVSSAAFESSGAILEIGVPNSPGQPKLSFTTSAQGTITGTGYASVTNVSRQTNTPSPGFPSSFTLEPTRLRYTQQGENRTFVFDQSLRAGMSDLAAERSRIIASHGGPQASGLSSSTGPGQSFRALPIQERIASLESSGFEVEALGDNVYQLTKRQGTGSKEFKMVSTYDAVSGMSTGRQIYIGGQLISSQTITAARGGSGHQISGALYVRPDPSESERRETSYEFSLPSGSPVE